MRLTTMVLAFVISTTGTATMAADAVQLYAAGSLKAAMGDIADAFEKQAGVTVGRTFAPSGLLRGRIEEGEVADVFASANMKHPRTLEKAGRGGPVVMFARNRLCALAQADSRLSADNFLDTLLDEDTVVGTSTPKADPSGDYAWKLFEKADAIRAGSFAALDAKAKKLTGGPDSPEPPEGRFKYAWVMTEFRLSPAGQEILSGYGFVAPALP